MLADEICSIIDAALNVGKQGEIDTAVIGHANETFEKARQRGWKTAKPIPPLARLRGFAADFGISALSQSLKHLIYLEILS